MFDKTGYQTKEAAVAAIKAAGFTMEPNSSGNGDKLYTVTDGEYPGKYCDWARPVEDPHTHIWYVLVDTNRYEDLPRIRLTPRQALEAHERTFWRAPNCNEWMAIDAQLRAYLLRQERREHWEIKSIANDDYARHIMGITDADQNYP